jgi:drug/metabolite transporter (DMT)-like permease
MPRWFLYSLVTMLFWGGWGVVSKPISTSLSPWQVQSLSTIGLLPVLAVMVSTRRLGSGSNLRRGFAQAFAAGMISSAGNIACYQALAIGGKAAAVIPLTSLYPLVTIILAMVALGERLNLVQWAGIGVSFAALYFFSVEKGAAWISPWLAAALVPIVLWGISGFLQKLATGHASNELVTFAFLLGFVPVAVLIPVFQPLVWQLSGVTWLLLFLLGLSYGVGNLTLIIAYGTGGRASIVTLMTSLYSLITIPLAVLLLHEQLSSRQGIGIVLALLAVVALGRETPAAPSAAAIQ